MRNGGPRRIGAVSIVAVTVWAVIAALVAGTPASADGKPGHERQRVDIEVAGTLCPTDDSTHDTIGDTAEATTAEYGRRGRVTTRSFTGRTDGNVDVLDGEATIELALRHRRGGRIAGVGRWELQPDGSTGSIGGWVAVVGDGRIIWSGRGDGSLTGLRVRAIGSIDGDADGCEGGLRFDSAGRATRPAPTAPTGAVQVTSTKPFGDAVADLTAAIEANPNLTLVRVVDHAAAAASRGLVLGPTVELFFGNPNLGTPLMQSAQTTGIDLPQKILIWEDLLGTVRVAYNAPAHLQSRHGIEGADGQLTTVAGALAALTGVATGTEVEPVFDAGRVPLGAGLVTIESTRSPDEAFAAIVAAVEAAPPVNVAIELEHDANAARVGLDLDPTKLVVFGNPSLGTGLMQTERSVALDLPQKILVHRSGDGPTLITWNDPHWVAERHGVVGQDAVLDILAGALANFAAQGR